MAVTYDGLRKLLKERGLQFRDLIEARVCGSHTVAVINQDEYVTLKVLERIAKHLDCSIGDIVDVVKE